MQVLRVLLNGVIMLAEVALVVGAAWIGLHHPFLFAALTAGLSLLLGLQLEAARLRNELPFYFEAGASLKFLFVPLVGVLEAVMKAVLAGLAALFTFSGTDPSRLFWVAVLFGLTVYAGSSLLRVLSIKASAHPQRWGYFRLGTPLGLLFSAGLAVLVATAILPPSNLADIGWKIVWDMPAKPTLEQVSELFFQLKQAFDDFVVALLSTVLPPDWARVAGVLASVNVLAGFVAAVYAAIIAAMVRGAEARLP